MKRFIISFLMMTIVTAQALFSEEEVFIDLDPSQMIAENPQEDKISSKLKKTKAKTKNHPPKKQKKEKPPKKELKD